MELHPTPFPVKSKYMKTKSTRRISEATKTSAKCGPPLLSQKRVFGTARNPNVPSKPPPEKPTAKSSSALLKKALKPTQTTPPGPPISEAKNSSDKNTTKTKTKSVCFQENEGQKNGKNSRDGNVIEPQTPAKSPKIPAKPRLSATPYRSAERCSKCRFDRLETSAYWLGQIKLSESVGKHFVSADFFKLALDCKAEPIRNIRVELKKYLARHDYLNSEEEWKKLAFGYGLVKEDSGINKGGGKADADEENTTVHNQDNKDLQNEIAEGNEMLNPS